MSETRLLDEDEFGAILAGFGETAFRLELQDTYTEPSEERLLAAFLAGEPFPATEVPELRAWYQQVTRQTEAGKRVERVRVQREPPTPYQRFERWLGTWNLAAGETIRYVTRERAHAAGLLPGAGECDWWLLDSSRLLVMSFDAAGHRVRSELATDPETVAQARVWRDLALDCATADLVPPVVA